jgi:hypothetical protein
LIAVFFFAAGCTATHTAKLGGVTGAYKQVIISTGDIDREHRSIGIVQVTSTGMWLLGFFNILSADFESAITNELSEEARFYGADAVINVQFYELQYPLLLKVISVFSILSPQYAVVTGELVEFIGD